MSGPPIDRLTLYRELCAIGAPPPYFTASADRPGEIMDANGRVVLIVAPSIGERKAKRVARLVAVAVNSAHEQPSP